MPDDRSMAQLKAELERLHNQKQQDILAVEKSKALNEFAQKFFFQAPAKIEAEAYQEYRKQSFNYDAHQKDHQARVHTTESVSAMMMAFVPTIEALGHLNAAALQLVMSKVLVGLAETLPQTPFLVVASLIQDCQAKKAEPFDLASALVPYLAEVNAQGVLTCQWVDDELGNTVFGESSQFETFNNTLKNSIKMAFLETRHYDVVDNNGQTTVLKDGQPISALDFADFRQDLLSGVLSDKFGVKLFTADREVHNPSLGR